jgi:hypothetical protein
MKPCPRSCEHPHAPYADGLERMPDDEAEAIPLERLRDLHCVVQPKEAPPWWCPLRCIEEAR